MAEPSRRRLFSALALGAAAVGGAGPLTGCGTRGGDTGGGGGSGRNGAGPGPGGAGGSSTSGGGGPTLLQATPPAVVGRRNRLVFVVQKADGTFLRPDGARLWIGPRPSSADAPVPVTAHADTNGAPPYLRCEFDVPAGDQPLLAHVEAPGLATTSPVEVGPEPAGLQPGQPLPDVSTPTNADPAGVEVVCTRAQPCPLHDRTLAQLRSEQRPLAVLISTPAFCQTAVCGPVLDLLLGVRPRFPQVNFLHLEVYARRVTTSFAQTPLAPAVQAFGLRSEPSLFLADRTGVVRHRLDGLFGTGEVSGALAALA